MQILKISGTQIDDPAFLHALGDAISQLQEPTVIVHGGGKEITRLQTAFGIQARYIDGLRVSDPESLELVKMVLCGAVNPRLVALLQHKGVMAQGLSGIDQGLVWAKKMQHPGGDLGWVGEVAHVRAEVLHGLLEAGVTPVIAPICLGDDGVYNVNADHVAGAVGVALAAARVVFLTDVPGVLHEGRLLPNLTPPQAEEFIAQGIINGGMIPKVRTALDVVERGAARAVITNLDGLLAQNGTVITP